MGTNSNRSAGTQVTQKGVTQGVTLVDPVTGLPVGVIQDNTGVKRLAVDADITVDNITVDTRDLDASTDNVGIKDKVSGYSVKVNSDGSIDANTIISASSQDNIAIGNTWKKIIDQPDANTTYIGLAIPGSTTSGSVWQIKRILVSGTETFIEFSGGNLNFSNIWDNRTTLSYS